MPEYIDREAFLKHMRKTNRYFGVKFDIEEFPAADVEPVRHGRWEGEGDGYAETDYGEMALVYDVWSCSKCGHIIDDGTDDPELLPNYCPNCGAKMDEEVKA